MTRERTLADLREPRPGGGVDPLFRLRIVCVDPGPVESAWCAMLAAPTQVVELHKVSNHELVALLRGGCRSDHPLIIEDIESFGMPVGREVFRTAQWAGRFVEAHEAAGGDHRLMPRSTVKLALCASRRAKDPHIRQAVIDRLGEPPTKARPNARLPHRPAGDEWSALAIGLAYQQLVTDGEDGKLERLETLDGNAAAAAAGKDSP